MLAEHYKDRLKYWKEKKNTDKFYMDKYLGCAKNFKNTDKKYALYGFRLYKMYHEFYLKDIEFIDKYTKGIKDYYAKV